MRVVCGSFLEGLGCFEWEGICEGEMGTGMVGAGNPSGWF